jgi:hypothetical protein
VLWRGPITMAIKSIKHLDKLYIVTINPSRMNCPYERQIGFGQRHLISNYF